MMFGTFSLDAVLILLVCFFWSSLAIHCPIGFGQRGLNNKMGFQWPRECPESSYCWEAVTTDVNKVKKLFDFTWDTYYSQYYVQGCGGAFGTDPTVHPLSSLVTADGKVPALKKGQIVPMNVTTPPTITGRGGTSEMNLNYVCIVDFCMGNFAFSVRMRAFISVPLIISLSLATLFV